MGKTYRKASRWNKCGETEINDKMRDGKAYGRKYYAGEYPRNGWGDGWPRRKNGKNKQISSKKRRLDWERETDYEQY